MTQVELSTFLAIVKYGSISLAAEKLYITQPAISRRLLSLENELGYALLERRKGKRAMELTPEGREFISVAQRWLSVEGCEEYPRHWTKTGTNRNPKSVHGKPRASGHR